MSEAVISMLWQGVQESLYMTIFATLFGYLLGLPMGVLLSVTDQGGLSPNRVVYRVLDVIANVVRSTPFLILLILIIPVTKAIVEGSLKEVDAGVIEAAQSMGATTFQIIWKVLLVEARTSLITGATIALGTILGYSALAGAVGGGGLGDIAIQYGYYRYETDIMIVTVLLLILLFQVFQMAGNAIASRLDKRK